MKSTYLCLLCVPILASALTGCGESVASTIPTGESGAQFRENEGLLLSDKMSESIGLKLAEVEEESIAAVLTVSLQPARQGNDLEGWITAEQAKLIKPGMEATLPSGKGFVTQVSASPFPALGDFELVMKSDTVIPAGRAITATFRLPASDSVASIPTEALLTTAEGNFVYTRNGRFFIRTAISIGARNEDHVEVTDGLYTGDEIVVSPVNLLWLAELQVLRGGKPCTCGH